MFFVILLPSPSYMDSYTVPPQLCGFCSIDVLNSSILYIVKYFFSSRFNFTFGVDMYFNPIKFHLHLSDQSPMINIGFLINVTFLINAGSLVNIGFLVNVGSLVTVNFFSLYIFLIIFY